MKDEESIEFHDISIEGDSAVSDNSTAFHIAGYVMQEFEPGFVIVGSPYYGLSENGVKYPSEIGILLHNLTKTELADILLTVASQLNGDVTKVENFLREALGND